MAILFLIFLISMLFIYFGWRKTALAIALVNLLFILALFFHHMTDSLKINL